VIEQDTWTKESWIEPGEWALPFLAQGAAQAIEDGVTLTAVFSNLDSPPPSQMRLLSKLMPPGSPCSMALTTRYIDSEPGSLKESSSPARTPRPRLQDAFSTGTVGLQYRQHR
jgi:hypothetical protein